MPGWQPPVLRTPPRRQPGGPGQARLRLRPPVLLLRHPVVPRVLRVAPAARHRRRGATGWRARACARSSSSARTRRRTARTWATCACSRRCCRASRSETSVERVRVAYLQPAEVRPDLLAAIASTPVVAPYYDLSFQHASPTVLRRMRRFGGRAEFLDLVDRIRGLDPAAGIRSNVIVGFPGETEEEFADLLALPRAGAARRRRRLRLQRRGRDRGGDAAGQDRRGRRPRPRRAGDRAGRRGHGAARRGPHRRDRARARSSRSTTTATNGRWASGGPATRVPTTPARSCASATPRSTSATSSRRSSSTSRASTWWPGWLEPGNEAADPGPGGRPGR